MKVAQSRAWTQKEKADRANGGRVDQRKPATRPCVGIAAQERLARDNRLRRALIRRIERELNDCVAGDTECLGVHIASWTLAAACAAQVRGLPFDELASALCEDLGPEIMLRWADYVEHLEQERGNDAIALLREEIDHEAGRMAHAAAVRELAAPGAERLQRKLSRQYRRALLSRDEMGGEHPASNRHGQ